MAKKHQLITFDSYLAEKLKNPAFKKIYEREVKKIRKQMKANPRRRSER